MIQFILNNKLITTDEKSGSTLLDFVRYTKELKGTKIGCREGDCGACTVLMGQLKNGVMQYESLTSCITPLGNAANKHVVTIEGLNIDGLTPYQQAMVDESGQQCGFCTVGFIVSFAGECLRRGPISYESIISAIDGNICRCTGYKSIERAAKKIHEQLKQRDHKNLIGWLTEHKYLPNYFVEIPDRIRSLKSDMNQSGLFIGGGTDLIVQQHDGVYESELSHVRDNSEIKGIAEKDGRIHIGAATNTSSLLHSEIMNRYFPRLYQHLKLVSSTPIRNIATIAGNFINASPIGDLTAYFIALDSNIVFSQEDGQRRSVKLKDIYLGYKSLDKSDSEYVSELNFEIPNENTHFNFEKVSKRRYLDIASVNTAISIEIKDNSIKAVHLSAGGVSPIPLYLQKTCDFLTGKVIDENTVRQGGQILLQEISPISDARGTAEYKSLLLRQLYFAHFIELFPEVFKIKSLA